METKNGVVKRKSRIQGTSPERCYRNMVEMFQSGKEPLSNESILKPAVLEAMEKSVASEKWEEVIIRRYPNDWSTNKFLLLVQSDYLGR